MLAIEKADFLFAVTLIWCAAVNEVLENISSVDMKMHFILLRA